VNRRELIKSAAVLSPLIVAGRAYAAPKAGSRLLVVFLRGAYDAMNIVAPTGSDFYYQSRPTLALARPDPANPDAALPLDADWSLHPALRDSMLPLWKKGQLAFVPFAGTDDMSRSHFETQDTIELGQPITGARDYQSGFMGRLAQTLSDGRPISFTGQIPLCFRGSSTIPNLALPGGGRVMEPYQASLIEAMYKDQRAGTTDLGQSVTEGFATRETLARMIAAEKSASARGGVSARGLELSCRRIGQLMRDQYNLAFVDVGGWDTHTNQGAAKGYLASRIGELGNALSGFVDEIGPDAWSNTTVVVVSEFGRAFHENGNNGTDHGHGSVYWVLGGGVRGGRMVGPQVALTKETLNQGRDLPVLTDYRELIGGIVRRQFGLHGEKLQAIFPNTHLAKGNLV
jgi:uncharacterized protein (DUF1501 family)